MTLSKQIDKLWLLMKNRAVDALTIELENELRDQLQNQLMNQLGRQLWNPLYLQLEELEDEFK